MSRFQYYTMKNLIRFFLEQGKEGDCWDFKQEWHENIADLIKDIICFANTVHDENCYLIFGVSDDLSVTGMKKARRKQADIIDTISTLTFAGDAYPAIDIKTVVCNGVQREHNKKLNNGLPILHKVPPKRDYGRYFCIMAEKGGTSHGGLTEKLSPFFHAKKQEVNAYGR